MNLRQLEYFLTAVRAGSLTRAAKQIGVAQPTLTKSVRALEKELGVRLFERVARGIVLTPSGEVLSLHAQRIGVQMQDAVDEVRSMLDGTPGTVRIGAGPAWLRRVLPEAVANVMPAHPSLHVVVIGGFDDVLLRMLRAGEVDFVIAELPSSENARDLDLEALTGDQLSVCARASHPLAGRDDVGMGDLLAYPWAMPPHSTRAQQRLMAQFVAADLPAPRMQVETESMAFLLNLVARSDALTYTVSTTLGLPEAAGLVTIPTPDLEAHREAGIILLRNAFVSPAARLIHEELRRLSGLDRKN